MPHKADRSRNGPAENSGRDSCREPCQLDRHPGEGWRNNTPGHLLVKHVGFAEAQVKALELVGVFVQQITEIGCRLIRGCNGQ